MRYHVYAMGTCPNCKHLQPIHYHTEADSEQQALDSFKKEPRLCEKCSAQGTRAGLALPDDLLINTEAVLDWGKD